MPENEWECRRCGMIVRTSRSYIQVWPVPRPDAKMGVLAPRMHVETTGGIPAISTEGHEVVVALEFR